PSRGRTAAHPFMRPQCCYLGFSTGAGAGAGVAGAGVAGAGVVAGGAVAAGADVLERFCRFNLTTLLVPGAGVAGALGFAAGLLTGGGRRAPFSSGLRGEFRWPASARQAGPAMSPRTTVKARTGRRDGCA